MVLGPGQYYDYGFDYSFANAGTKLLGTSRR